MIDCEEIVEVIEYAEQINVYNQGRKSEYPKGSSTYSDILCAWNEMVDGAYQMPAFGVSLNRETVKELKSGLWVEFEFSEVLECNEMPFEKLLIGVRKDDCGFNLIRYMSKAGYDGRCFYLNLNKKDMSCLYSVLQSL